MATSKATNSTAPQKSRSCLKTLAEALGKARAKTFAIAVICYLHGSPNHESAVQVWGFKGREEIRSRHWERSGDYHALAGILEQIGRNRAETPGHCGEGAPALARRLGSSPILPRLLTGENHAASAVLSEDPGSTPDNADAPEANILKIGTRGSCDASLFCCP